MQLLHLQQAQLLPASDFPFLFFIAGYGTVEFLEESLCNSFNIKKATGTFSEGKLTGSAKITFMDGSFLQGSFKEGVLHGLVRKFRCKFGLCDFFEGASWSVPKHL